MPVNTFSQKIGSHKFIPLAFLHMGKILSWTWFWFFAGRLWELLEWVPMGRRFEVCKSCLWSGQFLFLCFIIIVSVFFPGLWWESLFYHWCRYRTWIWCNMNKLLDVGFDTAIQEYITYYVKLSHDKNKLLLLVLLPKIQYLTCCNC